jgi:hypothetical protein
MIVHSARQHQRPRAQQRFHPHNRSRRKCHPVLLVLLASCPELTAEIDRVQEELLHVEEASRHADSMLGLGLGIGRPLRNVVASGQGTVERHASIYAV